MYDFFLGTPEQINANEIDYLISVKRMMPRWINSVPDSEFIAIAKAADAQGAKAKEEGRDLVLVETGAGASTLALTFYAMKYGGRAWTWDMNGAKGSAIRQVASETMGRHFHAHVDEHWTLVAYNSLSRYLGIPILNDLAPHIDFFFGDSEHVWDTVKGELEAVIPLLIDGSVVALDDANQDYQHTNVGYINTFRSKLGLEKIPPIEGNNGDPFWKRGQALLEEHFETVEYLEDEYKKTVGDDPYFAYFNAEFDIKASLKTERTESLEHRFDSFRVAGRKSR
jgi:hypothetical protein